MKEVVIVKTAINTSLGDTLSETAENLYQGKSAIRPIEEFDVSRIDFQQAAWKKQKSGRAKQANNTCTLLTPVLDAFTSLPDDTIIIWCGVKGNAEFIEERDKGGQNPLMPHLAADYSAWVKDYLQLNANTLEINAACASTTVGIIYGSQWIARGLARSVLVCASDIVCRFTHMGFSALKALSRTVARPFDINRDGLNLGDGAVAIHLSDRDTANKSGSQETFTIKGWGISNDANHITGPARDGSGLMGAINKTLNRAGVRAEDIAAFCTHGTGTIYNDAMELTALESIFGKKRFPVFSIKGAIGHTLGAAGGIEAALCCLTLKERCVPPTAGIENPEERANGRVSANAQPLQGHTILTTNSGFGGINASLLIAREPS